MQMIRQDDNGIDIERIALSRLGDGVPKRIDMIDKQSLPPLQQIDGEEPASAWNERAAIVRHTDRLASAQYASLLRPTGCIGGTAGLVPTVSVCFAAATEKRRC